MHNLIFIGAWLWCSIGAIVLRVERHFTPPLLFDALCSDCLNPDTTSPAGNYDDTKNDEYTEWA
jgi:hypothetical protein